jgi:hypothetical protein
MKKILLLGLLAIGASALSQQSASAWVNSRFGIGLNWDYQSGGNQIAWGLWQNNQPGGADPAGLHGNKNQQQCAPAFVPGQAPNAVIVPQMPAPVVVPAPAPHHEVPAPAAPPAYMSRNPAAAYPTPYASPYQYATYQRPMYYYYYYAPAYPR